MFCAVHLSLSLEKIFTPKLAVEIIKLKIDSPSHNSFYRVGFKMLLILDTILICPKAVWCIFSIFCVFFFVL